MPEGADPTAEFVEVYDRETGRTSTVPAEWLDNPVLKQPFRKTPLSADQQRAADAKIAAANPDETPATGGEE